MSATVRLPLYRKDRPPRVAVGPDSIALFRLGEQCNNDCPMCSNSGRPEAFLIATDELLARVDRLSARGFRALFVTGGEPTIHPGFWAVIGRLGERGLVWDVNTHGRSFADADFTERARSGGLRRAIVSFHSHEVEVSRVLFGTSARGHEETVAGIERLADAGVDVILNCVLSTLNAPRLGELVRYCAARFGRRCALKLAFPSHTGKGGEWGPIQLTYRSVAGPLAEARAAAAETGMQLAFESFPSCVLGDALAINRGRSGCGESHYLEDLRGEELYSIAHIEAELSVYAHRCLGCRAFSSCPGVSALYADRHGLDELTPF